ncbi:hypothetical protein ES705_26313 [subsurface metagenome]
MAVKFATPALLAGDENAYSKSFFRAWHQDTTFCVGIYIVYSCLATADRGI